MSQRGGLKKAAKRERLYREQMGLCHWCRMPMRLVDFGAMVDAGEKNPQPDIHDATFEHLDCRLSLERGEYSGQRRIVLAHRLCNYKRGVAEEKYYRGTHKRQQDLRRLQRELNRDYPGSAYRTVWTDGNDNKVLAVKIIEALKDK